MTREDNVRFVHRSDGSLIADFEDGTRITTFYVRNATSQNDIETGESHITKDGKLTKYIKIECVGFATTIFNCESQLATLVFGNGTLATCNPYECSYNISHHNGENIDIDSNGVVTFLPK